MRGFKGSIRVFGTLMIGGSAIALHASTPPGYPPSTSNPIERQYYAAGPEEAAVVKVTTTQTDREGTVFDIYYPPLSTSNKRPIITFANGTDATAADYDSFLRHLAGWGFVVIATRDTNTGTGTTVWDAAQFLIDQNATAGSPYYNKLDIDDIAAVGHSQGAMGAIAALERSWYTPAQGGEARSDGKKIKTVITIDLPETSECGNNCTVKLLPAGSSIFLLTGAADFWISPVGSASDHGENSLYGYYYNVPSGVLKQRASANWLQHNDVQGQPNCTKSSCSYGVYSFLGYPVAWLKWQLTNDASAKAAFLSSGGELLHNSQFGNAASNIP